MGTVASSGRPGPRRRKENPVTRDVSRLPAGRDSGPSQTRLRRARASMAERTFARPCASPGSLSLARSPRANRTGRAETMDHARFRELGAQMEGDMVSDMVNRVTVLMPVFETPLEMLRAAVESILAQTLGNFELLILDDGSKSAPNRHYLERRAARDPRIRLRFEARRGLTA